MRETIKKSQSIEDYLESVYLLAKEKQTVHRIDVAKRMNVSQAAVNKAVKNLVAKAYVYEDGKHLYLTKEGETYAAEIYQRHCLLRAFLEKIGVAPATAEQDACHMEHVLSGQTFEAIKALHEKIN